MPKFKVEKNKWYFRRNGSRKGKKPLLFWLSPENMDLIKGMAGEANRPAQEVLSDMVEHCLLEGGYKKPKE